LGRIFGAVILAAVLWWARKGTEFDARRLVEGVPRGAVVVRQMFPPDWRLLWQKADAGGALAQLLVTVQMAVLGTFIGFLLAVPVSFVAARTSVLPRPI